MGRNLKDFYGNSTRVDNKGPEGGVVLSHYGKDLIATPDSGAAAVGRKVTRNRDVKKHGNRLAEVAVGNKQKLRGDS